jgi:hypothetical protein
VKATTSTGTVHALSQVTADGGESATHRFDGARRRQFLLGPARPRSIDGWQSTTVAPGSLLESGADLTVAQARVGDRELTILGFILDPTDPSRDDGDIARELVSVASLDALPLATSRFSGRWAIIARHGGAGLVFTDPAGLRQVHYALDRSGQIWCASQARLLARVLDLPVDDDADEFARSVYFRSYAEPFWPGEASRYRGVLRLLPNHTLDLRSGRVARFWPTHALRRDPTADPVHDLAALLQGSLLAASRRAPLALALTAGWDSRTLLAASHGLAADLLCFTIDNRVGGDNGIDVRIARRVTGRSGVRHLVIDGQAVEPGFFDAFQASVDTPHRYCAGHAWGLLRDLPAGRLAVTGNLSELGRSYFQTHYPGLPITARGFANVLNMQRSPWAVATIGRWLDDAMPVAARYGFDPVDLFHWELYCGTWLAAGQAEWDMATDTFSPFNGRLVLETVLSVDPARRKLPENVLHRDLMRELWPEVLAEPINPEAVRGRVAHATKRVAAGLLRRSRLYDRVRDAYLEARSRRSAR